MSMGIGTNTQTADYGEIKGSQEAIACGVWFTSKGVVMPKLIKYQDDQQEIRTINNIHVICFKEKNYCGIPTLEYECSTLIGTCQYYFHLLYYIERQEWKILWKHLKKKEG